LKRRIFDNKGQLLRVLKFVVILLSAWLLYKEVVNNQLFQSEVLAIFRGEKKFVYAWLAPIFILLFVNWALETLKWKVLINEFARPSFLLAYKAILTGVFVSFFTPNRVGEFAGRVIYLKEKKIEASLLTIAGSLAQNICTYLFGATAALFFFAREPLEWWMGAVFLAFLFLAVLFLFFNIDRIVIVFRFLKLPKKWLKYFIPIRHLSASQLQKTLAYSAIRYVVFSIQFYCMFQALSVPMSAAVALQGVGLMFLIHSIIPTIAMLEITTRGIAAHYAFQVPPEFDASILFASYAIWLINLFLPGMIGAVLFIMNKNKDVDL